MRSTPNWFSPTESSRLQGLLRVILAWPRRPAVLGAVVGVLGFLHYQNLALVDPTNVQAFIAGDWGTHMLGWLQFRHAPLCDLPLGQVPRLGYPLGTSLLFTDSIPLLALVLRPFSALLPTDFQYLGLWLLASFVLQGALGAQLAALYLRSRVAIVASAVLFVLMPAFLLRTMHPALTAHWILLAVLYGALRGPRRTRWGLVALVSLATLIQPYLWAFAVILLLGVLLDDIRWGAATWTRATASGAACLAASLGLLALTGGFSSRFQTATAGFGSYSANVLTFVTPIGMSRLVRMNTPWNNQSDGFAFLGLGVLSLLAVVVVLSLRDRRCRQAGDAPGESAVPLATGVAAVLLAVFALSDRIFVGSYEVVTISWLYDPIRLLVEKFRCSGRAIWPLMYLLVVLAIRGLRWLLARSTRRPELAASVVLAACAGIQYLDLPIPNGYDPVTSLAFTIRHDTTARYFFDKSGAYFVDRLSDPRWQRLGAGGYRHMNVVPTTLYGCDGGVRYEEGYYSGRIALLSLEAYRADLTFNSGYFSRRRVGEAESCAAQDHAASAHLDADTVYIFGDGYHPPPGSRCDALNGIRVCVSAQNADPFARSLAP